MARMSSSTLSEKADSYFSPPIRMANVKHECTMRMEDVKFWDFRASQQGKQKPSKHPFKFPSQRKLFSQSEKKVFLVRKKVFSRQRKKTG